MWRHGVIRLSPVQKRVIIVRSNAETAYAMTRPFRLREIVSQRLPGTKSSTNDWHQSIKEVAPPSPLFIIDTHVHIDFNSVPLQHSSTQQATPLANATGPAAHCAIDGYGVTRRRPTPSLPRRNTADLSEGDSVEALCTSDSGGAGSKSFALGVISCRHSDGSYDVRLNGGGRLVPSVPPGEVRLVRRRMPSAGPVSGNIEPLAIGDRVEARCGN